MVEEEVKTETEVSTETPKAEPEKEALAPAVETLSLVDKADQTATRLENALKKQEELIKRQEGIMAYNRLGGRTEAGSGPEPEKTPEEYAKDFLDGKVKDLFGPLE